MARVVVLRRFKPNRKGIALIAVSPQVKGAVHDVAANKALPYALGIAPPRSRVRHQHYSDSFQVDDTIVAHIGQPPMARAASRLANTAPHSIIVEVGAVRVQGGETIETPAHRVLGRTLQYLAASSTSNRGNRAGRPRPP